MTSIDAEIGESQIRSVDLYQSSAEVRRSFQHTPKGSQSTLRLLLPVGSGIPQDPITVAHEEGTPITLCKVSTSNLIETRDTLWKRVQPIYDNIIKLLERKAKLESEIEVEKKLREAYGRITGALMRDEIGKNVNEDSAGKALDALSGFESKYEGKHLECRSAGQKAVSELSEIEEKLLVSLRKLQSGTNVCIETDVTVPAKKIWWNLVNFRSSCECQSVTQPYLDISLRFAPEGVDVCHKMVVSYMIDCCTWHPSFEFRLYSKDPCKAQIKYCGNLQQTTEETWKDVKLALHTGHPEGMIEEPTLPILKVEFQEAVEGAVLPATPECLDGAVFNHQSCDSDMGYALPLSTSSLPAKSANETAYHLPGTYTISSGVPHPNMEIFRDIFPVKFVFYAAPEVSDSVFRAGLITNASGKVLLPSSNVPVFWDDCLVAKSHIDSVAPSEDIQLFFGVDQRIKLDITPRRKHRSETGTYLFGRTSQEVTTQRMTLKSQWDEEILLLMCLRLPRSEEKDIKVQLNNPNKSAIKDVQLPHDLDLIRSPGWNEMQQVKAKWYFNSHTHNCLCVLKLDPQEHRSIEFSYLVEHPTGKKVDEQQL